MRNLKKILALVLALMMVLSVMVTASAASPLEKYEDYASINPAYEKAVEVMTVAGVFSGNGNDFEPTRVLTRQEAATLITILATGGKIDAYKAKAETQFDDVPATHWASGFINYCASNELILGTGNNKYSPALELSYEQYAAMLLRVLKVDCTTDGKWYVPVRNNAISNGLMKGIESYTWTAGLTREAACQMTFNAMLANGTKTLAGYMVDGKSELVFDTYLEAYLIADSETERVSPYYITTGDLMSKFLVSYGEGFDLYGRPSDNYTYKDAEGETHTLYYPEPADFVYHAETLATTIATDMKGYYVVGSDGKTTYKVEGSFEANSWNNVEVNTDGVAGDLTAGGKLSAALAGLTDDNAVVEIFTTDEKAIEAIVVTNTKVGTVDEIIPATKTLPEMVKIGDLVAVNVGLKKGDVVTYTLRDTTVENLAAAEYIVGTLTSYTSKGAYTINGEVYTLALNAATDSEVATIRGKFGKEYAYYLGANDTIIYAGDVPGTETVDPVITDYVQIKDVNVVIDVTETTWPAKDITVNSITAQAYVMTLDGTVTVCSLPVVKATAPIANTTVAKGDYYTTVGKAVVELYDAKNTKTSDTTLSSAATAELKKAYNSWDLFTYTMDDSTMTLVDTVAFLTGSETVSGVAQNALKGKIDKTSVTATLDNGTVILNNNTKFILKDSKGNIVVKTGVASLAATEIASARVVVDVTVVKTEKDDKVEYTRVNVAELVIADGTVFNAGSTTPETVKDIVFITGDFTTTKNAKNEDVYTYTAINVKGEVLSLTGAKDLTMGLYTYNSKNELATTGLTVVPAQVGVIAGTTVQLGDSYYTVNDNAVITDLTGEGLETGAIVYFVVATVEGEPTNVVTNIFVVKAAE